MTGFKSRETYISDDELTIIDTYRKDNFRYRADAVRTIITLGLTSDEDVSEYTEKGSVRFPLSVTEAQDAAVEAIRKKLPNGHDTYDIAYRLVIRRGLRKIP